MKIRDGFAKMFLLISAIMSERKKTMRKMLKTLAFVLSALFVLMSFAACGNDEPKDTDPADTADTTADTPETDKGEDENETYIKEVRRINGTDIEVLYSNAYTGKDPRALKFAVKLDGEKQPFNLDYGYGGAIFFDHMLTLSLAEPLPEDAVLTLEHEGNTYDIPYEPYYLYEHKAECGIPVYGSRALIDGENTVKRAAEIIDDMLSESPEIVSQMIASGAKLAVFGKGEHAYFIPEHRGGYDEEMLYVEGFGGITCSITESNVWHWHSGNPSPIDKSYNTAYVNENILVHEFAHGIKIAGIDMMADQSLASEYQMVYRHAKASGLWPDSYAISNSDEFFATLSAIWFNVMNESGENDKWDGVRGPINTREELYNYDPVAYNFFAKIYPYQDLDGAWTPVPDTVTVTGLGKEEAPDYGDTEYTFAYPSSGESVGINFDATYKFSYKDADFIIDTAANSYGVGLWWDYLADYPDNAAMTYNLELVPGTEPETKDHLTTYKVYIKGVRDGYLYENGDYVTSAASIGTVPDELTEFTLVINEMGLATIGCGGRVLVVDPNVDPDNGTEIKLMDEGASEFYLNDVAAVAGNVLFIHNGKVDGSDAGAILAPGKTAVLEAEATLDGKTFVKWECSSGKIADEMALSTEFTMPSEGDAVVWAIYE